MYEIFTKLFDSHNSVIRPPEFDYIKRIYNREINNIVEYYQSRVFTVQSNHLLCRLIIAGHSSFEYEYDRYVDVSIARSPYLSKYFNFTSSISYGKIFDGIFYNGSSEIIIEDNNYFNNYDVISNWKTVRAVNVLDHDISNIKLLLPDGSRGNTEEGFASISINIPLLLLQYRRFVEDQKTRYSNTDSMLGVPHFVHMYVLPNMMYSHIELVLINRLINIYYGAPMGDALRHHPFQVTDYSSKIDKICEKIIRHIEGNAFLYESDLKNIPSFYYRDQQENLIMPDLARTRQVWWALLLTRMKIMKFLIDVGSDKGQIRNADLLFQLKIDFKRLLDDKIFESVLPEDIYLDKIEFVNQVLKL